MKTFVEFLRESAADSKEMPQEMTFTWDFENLPENEETLNTLQEIASKEGLLVKVDGNKLSLSLTRSQCDNGEANEICDFLKNYTTMIRKDQENASHEQFAQKTKAFKLEFEKMEEFVNYIAPEPKEEE